MAKAKTKNELDKDLMYSKLMPSLPQLEEAEPTQPEPEPDESGLSTLRAKLFGDQDASGSPDDRQILLANIMEDAVMSRLDDAFAKFNCCRCDRCRKDVVALALNRLPASYQVGSPSQLEKARKSLSGKDISAALVQAILKVRANPRH